MLSNATVTPSLPRADGGADQGAPGLTGVEGPGPVLRVDLGEIDDNQLVESVRAGDERAFELLYDRYQRRIGAFVLGRVGDHGRAEDITQDVFISALRRIRATPPGVAIHFKPWIYEIAKNACIDQFRRSQRSEEVSYDADRGLGAGDHARLVSVAPAPDVQVDAKQRFEDLRRAFGGLSAVHHQVLVLRELEGLSYREIGERLGMSRAAVESTLFRARRHLSHEFDELSTGRRCQRIQGTLSAAVGRPLASRDQRRVARHLSHCSGCRRHAVACGARPLLAPSARRLAAWTPWPLLALGRRLLPSHRDSAPARGASLSTLAQLTGSVSPGADSLGLGWAGIVAGAVAVAALGAGGVVAISGSAPSVRPAPVVSAASASVATVTAVARTPSRADRLGQVIAGSTSARLSSPPSAPVTRTPADALPDGSASLGLLVPVTSTPTRSLHPGRPAPQHPALQEIGPPVVPAPPAVALPLASGVVAVESPGPAPALNAPPAPMPAPLPSATPAGVLGAAPAPGPSTAPSPLSPSSRPRSRPGVSAAG